MFPKKFFEYFKTWWKWEEVSLMLLHKMHITIKNSRIAYHDSNVRNELNEDEFAPENVE